MAKDRYYGKAWFNQRQRPGKRDPFMQGWAEFQNGKASIAVWADKDDKGKMNLTLRPWNGKSKVYSHGSFTVVSEEEKVSSTAPDYKGEAQWGGQTYTVCAWVQVAEALRHDRTRVEAQQEIARLKKQKRYNELPFFNFTFELKV